MKVISTNTTTGLRPFAFHEGEQIKFMTNTRGGSHMWIDQKYPMIRKIYFAALRFIPLGKIDKETDDAIVKMMKLGKTDVLTDGDYHYTRAGQGWVRITNMHEFSKPNPYVSTGWFFSNKIK